MRQSLRFIPLMALGMVAMAASSYSHADEMSAKTAATKTEASATTATAASKKTTDFVNNAAISSMFEIESSKLALTKSSSDTVKKFAQQMIDDHTKASDKLKTTLSEAGLSITPPAGLDAKHQKILDKENTKAAAEFDSQYVKDQNKAHDEAIKLFKNYAKGGDNMTVQTFAAQTLPTLVDHKQMAMQLKVTRY